MLIDFARYRDRIIVAFAAAVALHEIFLASIHAPAQTSNNEAEAKATRIVLETPPPTPTPRPTPKPTPTPRPTPPPTPPPRVTPPPHVTPAPVKQVAGRAKGTPARRHGGGAHKAIAKALHGTTANPKAAGSGIGTSTGHGSGAQPGVGGGLGGTGTGGSGSGNAAVNANTPCGIVEFKPTGPPDYRSGTAYEPVSATVTFPDGHKETAVFPYRWVYPNGEQTDPWSSTNLKNPNFETTLKPPPPGADISSYPPLIQYIIRHTDSQGYTDLPECPKGRG